MAFNLTVLSNLLGTPLEPDFAGVDLLIEDVSEQLYRIDRTMFHVTASAERPQGRADPPRPGQRHPRQRPRIRRRRSGDRRAIGARRSGIAFGGRADIGHDAGNGSFRSAGDKADLPSVTALQSARRCALSKRGTTGGP